MKGTKKIILGILASMFITSGVGAETIEVDSQMKLSECFTKETATCKLAANIALDNQLVVQKGSNITLDLNDKTLDLANYSNYAITVKGELTIIGDGTVNVPGLYGIGTAVDLGTVTIKGGIYNQAAEGYYLFGNWHNFTIEDGTFNTHYCALNSFEYNGKKHYAYVKGGTFNNVDDYTTLLGYVIADGGTYNKDVSNYVKEGYAARLIGTSYKVGKLYEIINNTDTTYGLVEIDKGTAIPGETVTIIVTPNSTYELGSLVVKGSKDVSVSNNTFVMPDEDVTVTASFDKIVTTVAPTLDPDKKVEETEIVVENADKVNSIIQETLAADETLKEKIKDIEVKVEVQIGNVDVERFEKLEPELKKSIDEKAGKASVAEYFDITLAVLNAQNDNFVTNIEKLSKKIKLMIVLPDKYKNTDKNINRTYSVIREHKGVIETLPATLSDDGNYLAIESDSFSLYALAYEDKEVKPETTPQTFDGIASYLALGVLSLVGLTSICIYIKKRRV